MKKFFSILVAVALMFAFTACGTSGTSGTIEKGDNAIAELYDNGYDCVMSSCTENVWKGVFQKDGSFDEILLAVANMTDEEYKMYDMISFDNEDYEDQHIAIVTSVEDVEITDVTDKVPSQEELDEFVGKTISELEEAGFENMGYTGDEDGVYTFFYEGPVYCVDVGLEDGVLIEDIDDYSANDIRELVIGSMTFTGLSNKFLD